jgi:hypothetical protein
MYVYVFCHHETTSTYDSTPPWCFDPLSATQVGAPICICTLGGWVLRGSIHLLRCIKVVLMSSARLANLSYIRKSELPVIT